MAGQANSGGHDAAAARSPKLLDQVAAKMRLLHYAKRAEVTYVA